MVKNYPTYRKEIKSGDILAWSHRGWKSFHDFKIQMVRAFTRSEYSHVGIAWVVGGRVFVIEAIEPCARIYPLSRAGSFYHIPLNADWKPSTEEIALSYIGADYKQLDAVKAFFKPLGKNSTSECAALVLNILDKDGIDLGNRATPDAVMLEAQLHGYPTYFVSN
jgi:hypothetical protein